MKKYMIGFLGLILSTQTLAHVPSAIAKIAANKKITDTRSIVKEVENTDGNPCMPEGKSYVVEIQVKQAAFNYETSKVVYSWETVKTIGVDKHGNEMEVCAE